MKKLLSLLFLIPLIGFTQGIKFEKATITQLVTKAKKENKIIFINACSGKGECSLLDYVFTDKSLGDFYNSNFINAQFDVEIGEGIIIKDHYSLTIFPTALFIDSEGKVLNLVVGLKDSQYLLNSGEMALNPAKKVASQISKYDLGERDSAFLFYLAQNALFTKNENAKTYARAYYKTERNFFQSHVINLMYQTIDSPESVEFAFFQNNQAELQKIVDADIISKKLDDVVVDYAHKLIPKTATTTERVALAEKLIEKYRINKGKELSSRMGMYHSDYEGDFVLFEKYALEYVDKNYKKLDYESLNSTAWTFFEHINNKSSLEKALTWAKQSVLLRSVSANNDTIANLYYKLGDKNNARIYAETSIRIGKEKGENISETEALLLKLK